jgi:hypothetical protein
LPHAAVVEVGAGALLLLNNLLALSNNANAVQKGVPISQFILKSVRQSQLAQRVQEGSL